MDIRCSGPGPHIPADGVIGASDRPVAGMLCGSPDCAPAPQPDTTPLTTQVDPAELEAALADARKATTISGLRAATVRLGNAILGT